MPIHIKGSGGSQKFPSISVNSSGLVTATAGNKIATKQLDSSMDADFVAANIKSGVNIFGVTGTCASSPKVSSVTVKNELSTEIFVFWSNENNVASRKRVSPDSTYSFNTSQVFCVYDYNGVCDSVSKTGTSSDCENADIYCFVPEETNVAVILR